MQRLVTALILSALAIASVLFLPSAWFFVLAVAVVGWASVEFVKMAKVWAPGAPVEILVAVAPLAALILAGFLPIGRSETGMEVELFGAALLASVGVGTFVLLTRTPLTESFPAFGALAFGVPYFALPVASLYRLHKLDPWLVILLLAIVALGDSAAFYVGSRFGRRKLAPTISPNKTWEGAVASFAMAMAVTVGWSFWRLGDLDLQLLAVAALTALAAQVGDLVESMIKRGVGIKDSGNLLPGHGGMLDRVDALLFAAPMFLVSSWVIGFSG